MTDEEIDEEIELVPLSSGVDLRIIRWLPDKPAASAVAAAPWLLVHGLASNARMWDGVGRRLAASGCTAIAVDLRGHGQSSKPDCGYDIPMVAGDLALLIEALELGPAAVAGQSWGGNVVVELAHRRPELVSLLVGIDGGTIKLAEQWPEWDDCAEALAPPPLAGRPRTEIEEWVSSMAADWPAEGRAGTLANFETRSDQTIAPWLTRERHLFVLRGLWEHDPTRLFPEIQLPTLLIGAGDDGPPTPREQRIDEAVGLLPNGVAAWFRPAHHDVHAQMPEAVASLLLQAQRDPQFFS